MNTIDEIFKGYIQTQQKFLQSRDRGRPMPASQGNTQMLNEETKSENLPTIIAGDLRTSN
jgi:hypothetical protein